MTPEQPAEKTGLLSAIIIFTILRVGLVAALTAALMWVMPLIVAAAIAIVAQLPLSLILFRGPRRRLVDALARAKANRNAQRDELRRALGEEIPGD